MEHNHQRSVSETCVVDTDSIDGLTPESWDAGINVHLRPLALLSQALLPDLAAAIAVGRKRFQESQGLEARANALEETMETRKLVYKAKEKLMASGMSEQKTSSALMISWPAGIR